MIDDPLKHLPSRVIAEPVRHPAFPLKVPGNLVLEADVIHAEIEARGHIIVHGAAEHCHLRSELGSVFLLYGSMEYTRITAGKNIYVKHTSNSGLTAGEDIVIEKSVVRSVLRAGRKVISETDDGRIVGGRVEAEDQICVRSIGSADGTPTEVIVRKPRGVITFSEVFPGVRLQIGDCETTVTACLGEGFAVAEDGQVDLRLRVTT